MPAENISQLLEKLQDAAKSGDTLKIESVLAIPSVQKHILAGKNEILIEMAKNGHAAAIRSFLKFNLIKNTSYSIYGSEETTNVVVALKYAVECHNLEIVKLLGPIIHTDIFSPLYHLPGKLIPDNLEIVKFLLALPKTKETSLGTETKNIFYHLLVQAIKGDYLEIVEGLLELNMAGIFLCELSDPFRTDLPIHPLHLAANLDHLAIAYCLAFKIIATKREPDSYLKVWLPADFEYSPIKIQNQPVAIGNFLNNYEQEAISKISSLNVVVVAVKELNMKLSLDLTRLIMDYFKTTESLPFVIRKYVADHADHADHAEQAVNLPEQAVIDEETSQTNKVSEQDKQCDSKEEREALIKSLEEVGINFEELLASPEVEQAVIVEPTVQTNKVSEQDNQCDSKEEREALIRSLEEVGINFEELLASPEVERSSISNSSSPVLLNSRKTSPMPVVRNLQLENLVHFRIGEKTLH